MAEYKIDDIVIYGSNGVCRVSEIEQREMGEYYILRPVHNARTTLLVPMFNERLVSRIREVPSESELRDAIERALTTTPDWIPDNDVRKAAAREVLDHGTEFDILMLVRSFKKHKLESVEMGKKTTMSDNAILKDAEKHVRDELSVVFGIELEDVHTFLEGEACRLGLTPAPVAAQA